MEPSPRAVQIVSNVLLPNYGWRHQYAGIKYPETEMSFRATLNGATYTDRGFKVNVNRIEKRIEIIFDSTKCIDRHREWLITLEKK